MLRLGATCRDLRARVHRHIQNRAAVARRVMDQLVDKTKECQYDFEGMPKYVRSRIEYQIRETIHDAQRNDQLVEEILVLPHLRKEHEGSDKALFCTPIAFFDAHSVQWVRGHVVMDKDVPFRPTTFFQFDGPWPADTQDESFTLRKGVFRLRRCCLHEWAPSFSSIYCQIVYLRVFMRSRRVMTGHAAPKAAEFMNAVPPAIRGSASRGAAPSASPQTL